MKKIKKRRWMARIWRLPHAAGETASRLFGLVPSRLRLIVFGALLVIPTTILVSRLPVSIVPAYKAGDVALQDVVIPIDLQHVRQPSSIQTGESDHRQHILLRSGEALTDWLVALVDLVRRHHLAERSPKRILFLLAIVALISSALYRAAQPSQSSRLDS